ICLTATPDLLPDTNTYCVTVLGAHSADGSVISPNPATCCLVHGAEYPAFHVLIKKWDNMAHGNNVDTFLALPHYQDPPDHLWTDTTPASQFGGTARPFSFFESPWTDIDDNFGDEAIGYWVVPQTGSYDLWI